ncbi:hypothetical protein PoB_006143600 [Plakobranchus ocellatus]|uniref:Uncharacterized protein n=1 Tax=Plakobranchus ocellatus TaxID=259542 RepID=A0AAV4CSR6_9GAST|nr:hypothetical protein PoB_006143600 [Plakobranchus ocellatus]
MGVGLNNITPGQAEAEVLLQFSASGFNMLSLLAGLPTSCEDHWCRHSAGITALAALPHHLYLFHKLPSAVGIPIGVELLLSVCHDHNRLLD